MKLREWLKREPKPAKPEKQSKRLIFKCDWCGEWKRTQPEMQERLKMKMLLGEKD